MENKLSRATLAGGCFWCTEALFLRLRGVKSAVPGYTGGTLQNPTYDDVSSGTSGHAEAVQIEFDPAEISFGKILDVFFATHDPTSLNRQGNDIGTQYRSAVFYHDAEQKQIAEQKKQELDKSGEYSDRLVTEIVPFTRFYRAEDYHKRYFDKNREAPYCSLVIAPKIHKLLLLYGKDMKEEYR